MSADIVITNARVIHGDGRVTPRATVVISRGRIERIDAGGQTPPATHLIDAAGRTAIPGLIDAHVHVEDWMLPLFLKYGVTTVRDLHNTPSYIFPLALSDSPARPRIVAAGALVDAPGSFWRNAEEVADVSEARAAVRREIARGARVIKVYTRLEPSLVAVVAAEARARGVPVAAHVGRASAVEAADAGITSLEHLSGVADAASANRDRLRRAHDDFLGGWTAFEREWRRLEPSRLDAVARRMIDRDVTIVPTLALHEAFARLGDADLLADPALADVPLAVVSSAWDPRDIRGRGQWTPEVLADFKAALPVLHSFVATYWKLGGRVVAGTDTAQQFVVPGASLHRELELYVKGGLSPESALHSATSGAAQLLGIGDETGTLIAGKAADLMLLEGDPLANISATRRIWKVIKDGVVVR